MCSQPQKAASGVVAFSALSPGSQQRLSPGLPKGNTHPGIPNPCHGDGLPRGRAPRPPDLRPPQSPGQGMPQKITGPRGGNEIVTGHYFMV